jgi:hypothetical protein
MDIFVGIDAPFTIVKNTKLLIDEVKSYANFFVVGSTTTTWNAKKLNEVCQYLNDRGLYFSTYLHPSLPEFNFSIADWNREARQKWPSRFLGECAYDEAGGNQIDRTQFMVVKEADNYTDAAVKFIGNVGSRLNEFNMTGGLVIFVDYSDYVPYGFDYDAVLADYAWNHSRPLNVAL